jgi:hypothetical protein
MLPQLFLRVVACALADAVDHQAWIAAPAAGRFRRPGDEWRLRRQDSSSQTPELLLGALIGEQRAQVGDT